MKDKLAVLVKDYFGLLAVILGVISAIGFSISTPWPAKADVEAIQRQIETQQRQINQQQCLMYHVLLKGYQNDLAQAEEELAITPTSASARRSKQDAESQIQSITAQMRASNCL